MTPRSPLPAGLATVVALAAMAAAAGTSSTVETVERDYLVGPSTSALGPTNCYGEQPELPAIDAVCIPLDPADGQVNVTIQDASNQTVLARWEQLDSNGNHLKSALFCDEAAIQLIPFATELRVWLQPSWAAALNTADGALFGNELACEEHPGTTGVLTAEITPDERRFESP